ncbi:class A beta-lactamase [Sorangium cellulosum]|uniref:Beta-lactamase n=1 Tax=Sorangium cellulosum TaxID=56 RepID=A0A150Q6J4_SORCE|nr:class A beta-lactamase [Sorangium cellulosum]KYF63386.1 class A beta-lactamase [Sorangium cellulosum]
MKDPPHSSRRGFLGGAASILLVGCGGAQQPRPAGAEAPGASAATAPAAAAPTTSSRTASPEPPAQTAPALARIEAQLGGRLGVAALDTANGARIGHRAGERFAMCSTFKSLLAACVLARVDQGQLTLDRRIAYRESDLLEHAPVARARLAEGSLTVEELCAAAVEVSDNTAANLLLAQIGGPAGLTAYLRGLGDQVTRLDRDEPALNTNLPGDPRDTSTPDAMTDTYRSLLVGDRALREASRARLKAWMVRATTGLARLRAGLPRDWVVGDKTGTGENGIANDVAVAWPPSRAPIVVACFVEAPSASVDARNAAHAEVARLVAAAFG